jgi:hypothetical protein
MAFDDDINNVDIALRALSLNTCHSVAIAINTFFCLESNTYAIIFAVGIAERRNDEIPYSAAPLGD